MCRRPCCPCLGYPDPPACACDPHTLVCNQLSPAPAPAPLTQDVVAPPRDVAPPPATGMMQVARQAEHEERIASVTCVTVSCSVLAGKGRRWHAWQALRWIMPDPLSATSDESPDATGVAACAVPSIVRIDVALPADKKQQLVAKDSGPQALRQRHLTCQRHVLLFGAPPTLHLTRPTLPHRHPTAPAACSALPRPGPATLAFDPPPSYGLSLLLLTCCMRCVTPTCSHSLPLLPPHQ